jgi:hypothetical protein
MKIILFFIFFSLAPEQVAEQIFLASFGSNRNGPLFSLRVIPPSGQCSHLNAEYQSTDPFSEFLRFL